MGMYGNGMYGGYMPPIQPQIPQYTMQQQQQMQPQQTTQQSVQNQVQTPQIQNGGFVSVRSENDARNYPVAPGNSITFRDENSPFIYVKTMGFSQLDRPVFDKFKLVKVEDVQEQAEITESQSKNKYISKEEIQPFFNELNSLKKEVLELKGKISNKNHNRNREKRNDGEVMK